MRGKRFSKWEMIATAVMIVALTAILCPTCWRAFAKAGEEVCVSNEKAIGLAILMYANDHASYLPAANHLPSRQGPPSLVDTLRPYRLSHDDFVCAGDRQCIFRREGLSYNYGFGRLDIGQPPQLASRPFGEDPATFHLLADFGLDWHPHGRTTLFADGHVKVLPKSEFQDSEMREP
jgi:prepilin-type processing-associated H-X9-DG protein